VAKGLPSAGRLPLFHTPGGFRWAPRPCRPRRPRDLSVALEVDRRIRPRREHGQATSDPRSRRGRARPLPRAWIRSKTAWAAPSKSCRGPAVPDRPGATCLVLVVDHRPPRKPASDAEKGRLGVVGPARRVNRSCRVRPPRWTSADARERRPAYRVRTVAALSHCVWEPRRHALWRAPAGGPTGLAPRIRGRSSVPTVRTACLPASARSREPGSRGATGSCRRRGRPRRGRGGPPPPGCFRPR
jgi:hypothetical protein